MCRSEAPGGVRIPQAPPPRGLSSSSPCPVDRRAVCACLFSIRRCYTICMSPAAALQSPASAQSDPLFSHHLECLFGPAMHPPSRQAEARQSRGGSVPRMFVDDTGCGGSNALQCIRRVCATVPFPPSSAVYRRTSPEQRAARDSPSLVLCFVDNLL